MILPQHPRANGLVEYNNGLIISGLQRMVAVVPDALLEDPLPDILDGLRFLPHCIGYQPYFIVLKQYPYCLGTGLDVQRAAVEGDLPGNVV